MPINNGKLFNSNLNNYLKGRNRHIKNDLIQHIPFFINSFRIDFYEARVGINLSKICIILQIKSNDDLVVL